MTMTMACYHCQPLLITIIINHNHCKFGGISSSSTMATTIVVLAALVVVVVASRKNNSKGIGFHRRFFTVEEWSLLGEGLQ